MSTVYFQGTAYWAKLKNADVHPQYYPEGRWSIQVALDEPSLKVLEDSGSRLQVKEDDRGHVIQLRRDRKKMIKDSMVEFSPPEVTDSEGNDISDTLIGNGSRVTAKVIVYDTRFGKGHRLEGVRVEELVPYEGGDTEVIAAEGVDPF